VFASKLVWLSRSKPAVGITLHIALWLTNIFGGNHHLSFLDRAMTVNEAYSKLVAMSSKERYKFRKDLVAIDELLVRVIDRGKAVVQRRDGDHCKVLSTTVMLNWTIYV